MRPSRFGCSPGTYGDRSWTTALQKRLMAYQPRDGSEHTRIRQPWAKAPPPTPPHASMTRGPLDLATLANRTRLLRTPWRRSFWVGAASTFLHHEVIGGA